MSDVPAYMLANFHVHAPDTYTIYEKGLLPVLKKHGGCFLLYDDNALPL